MITADAKCVVNGPKLNEAINALNPLLGMDIIIGNVSQPEIKYSSDSVQIVIPPGGGSTNEQLDVVDANNTAAQRWFMTTDEQGDADTDGDSSAGTNVGSPQNKTNDTTGALKDRDNLGGGGGGGVNANRDQLAVDLPAGQLKDNGGQMPLAPGGRQMPQAPGGRQMPQAPQVMPQAPGGEQRPLPGAPPRGGNKKGAFGGGVDAFGNELFADGSRVTPAGMRRDDSGPLPGAPPPNLPDLKPSGKKKPAGNNRMTPGGAAVSLDDLKKGEWLPSKGGKVNLPELAAMQAAGNLSPYQQSFLDKMRQENVGGKLTPVGDKRSPGNARDFEAQRRGLEKYRKKKQQRLTEKYIMDANTKKRQAAADKMHRDNQMQAIADGDAYLANDGSIKRYDARPNDGLTIGQRETKKRQAEADRQHRLWSSGAKYSPYARGNG